MLYIAVGVIWVVCWYLSGKLLCAVDRDNNKTVEYLLNAVISIIWPVVFLTVIMLIAIHFISKLSLDPLFKKIGW